ncbi:MAG: hypothetical protein MUC42_13355 [Bryobacter sp.]|nr:hypothetical protein [Bryobacter sp.]
MINLSGHSGTAYFEPIPQSDIEITLPGSFRTARAVRLGRDLPPRNGTLRLPLLRDYELLVLR